AARGEHEVFRCHAEAGAAQTSDRHTRHFPSIRSDVDLERVRVENAGDVSRLRDDVAVHLPEPCRRAELIDRRVELDGGEGDKVRSDTLRRLFDPIVARRYLTNGVGGAIVRLKLAERKRPTAFVHPRPLAEIHRIQGTAPATHALVLPPKYRIWHTSRSKYQRP